MYYKRGKLVLAGRAQVTIFIIIALVIIAGFAVFFLVRGYLINPGIPKELQPVYTYFESCIKENIKGAVNLAETQGGWIYMPEFERGNDLFPSSSQMNFFGFPVPYWNYISISGARKEQMPGKSEIEEQISKYVIDSAGNCDFSQFLSQGFDISFGSAVASTTVNGVSTDVDLNLPVIVSFNNVTSTKSNYKISYTTKLGKFYDTAAAIYQKQKSESFLENYGLDILRLYAPVDGIELSCAPKVWNPNNIVSEVLEATEANIAVLKLKSNDDYKLKKPENKYFTIDYSADENVRFMYTKNSPTKIEIWPAENNLMIAESVGQDAGMGIMGFCYVPYHFVYDFIFPVMIQVYDNNEIFQFPVVATIEKNQVNAVGSEAVPDSDNSICNNKNTPVNVYTYNTKLEPIAANISYRCVTTTCQIGETSVTGRDAALTADFPACVNGFIIAKSDGYATASQIISTNEESSTSIILEKQYELGLNITGIGRDMAVVNFASDKDSVSAVYPEQKKVKLSEGYYNISVSVYKNTTIVFPATNNKKCIQISKSGIAGLFGGTEEKCFDYNIPSQTITSALSGGGTQQKYFIESELAQGKNIILTPVMFMTPKSLDDLQKNYISFETNNVGVEVI